MKKILNDFGAFAIKGNVLDLAVGVIIGTAFGKIVSSLVDDIFMPVLGLIAGKVDFSDLAVTVGSSTIRYGMFINNSVNFLIVAFALFLIIVQVNRLRKLYPKDECTTTEPTPKV